MRHLPGAIRILAIAGLLTAGFVSDGWSVAHALEFSKYHSQQEISAWLRELAAENPELASFTVLGKSTRDREIAYVRITSSRDANPPAIYINGTHHGNEKSSTESVLALTDYLVENAASAEVAPILERFEIYLQPLVNPDGHAANTRGDAYGRDPNRDYAGPEKPDSESFRIPEIQLVRKLVDTKRFRAAIAWHSGMEGVLWPWCHTPTAPLHARVFAAISKLSAEAMGMKLARQSWYDYPTSGEFTDYAYQRHGTLAVTFEASTEGTPPEERLDEITRRAVRGGVTFLREILRLEQEQQNLGMELNSARGRGSRS